MALACRRGASASTHSVEPISPHSSASHVAKTSVRFGRIPRRAASPHARAASSTLVTPLALSDAPGPQASRCAPMITTSSGNSLPRSTPNVLWMARNAAAPVSAHTPTRIVTSPAPTW
jgi:hypothetical protein